MCRPHEIPPRALLKLHRRIGPRWMGSHKLALPIWIPSNRPMNVPPSGNNSISPSRAPTNGLTPWIPPRSRSPSAALRGTSRRGVPRSGHQKRKTKCRPIFPPIVPSRRVPRKGPKTNGPRPKCTTNRTQKKAPERGPSQMGAGTKREHRKGRPEKGPLLDPKNTPQSGFPLGHRTRPFRGTY